MIDCPGVNTEVIRSHYDVATLFYRLLWGRHIHHGLWEATGPTSGRCPACHEGRRAQGGSPLFGDGESTRHAESPTVAQRRLTETLAQAAGIRGGEDVLDVGCGMGASSILLANSFGCRVTGITLSPLQRRWAQCSAVWHGAAAGTRFLCADAERVEFDAARFDVVWSIECTEHLFDKPAFFRKAAGWLRPGGRLAICAWLAGIEPDSQSPALRAEAVRQVQDVCEGFFCPSLGTAGDYRDWIEEAALTLERHDDWTDRVARTWEICRRRVRRTGIRRLACLFGKHTTTFLDRFDTILAAYRSGAMRYASFIAHKPE